MKKILAIITIIISINGCKSDGKEIVVSKDGHTFELANGTPFFWLGDTAWELFHR